MKPHKTFMKEKKTNIKYNDYSGLSVKMQLLEAIKYNLRPESLVTFQPCYVSSKVKNENGAIQADFRWLWQAADFSTRNPINKPATNNRRILMEAVFHCVRRVEKTVENIKRWHKNLSASAISKQVSICCINFPHELTCQISTNQSIKIGRRAWLMHDFG